MSLANNTNESYFEVCSLSLLASDVLPLSRTQIMFSVCFCFFSPFFRNLVIFSELKWS